MMRTYNRPLVSVVMPTYNTELSMLRAAVESIINQTYDNWELILINDCSTVYNDFSFLDKYHDDRIRLVHNESNIGCTSCINKGIRLSNGEYIARLDADDIALPRRLEYQVKYMESNPSVKVLSCRIAFIGNKHDASILTPNNTEYLKSALLFQNIISHSSVMIRRTLFDVDNLYYDELFKYAQDYDLWIRVLESEGTIRVLPRCLVLIRIHEAQISSTDLVNEQERYIKKVSRRQFHRYFSDTDKDDQLREFLVYKRLTDNLSIDDMNKWTQKVLLCNKDRGIFNQHYLRLAFAGRYIPFIVVNKSIKCLCFSIRTMFIEMIEIVFILLFRRCLGIVYSVVYGNSYNKTTN